MFLPLQSPHWAAVFFHLSIYMQLLLAGSCSSHEELMRILLFPSSQMGQINTRKKPWLTNRIQVRTLGKKIFLATHSIFKSCCPHALNVFVLTRGEWIQEKSALECSAFSFLLHDKSGEFWTNDKVKDFLSILHV